MDDFSSIPIPRRVNATPRRALRRDATELAEREEAGETAYGLPIDRDTGELSYSQILTSARRFIANRRDARRNIISRPKERCM